MGDFPIRGVREELPPGEQVLWQGAPDWRILAVRRFHARKVVAYFGLLLVWRALTVPAGESALAWVFSGFLVLALLAGLAVGAISLFCWLVERTTTYAVTSRRVVLRTGIALPSVLNLPLRSIRTAATSGHGDGSGNVALSLTGGDHVAWMLIWPHTRPWRLRSPEPTMVALPDMAEAAEALRTALAADAAARADARSGSDAAVGAADWSGSQAGAEAMEVEQIQRAGTGGTAALEAVQ
jgi:hypothetical protein